TPACNNDETGKPPLASLLTRPAAAARRARRPNWRAANSLVLAVRPRGPPCTTSSWPTWPGSSPPPCCVHIGAVQTGGGQINRGLELSRSELYRRGTEG